LIVYNWYSTVIPSGIYILQSTVRSSLQEVIQFI